MSWLGITGSTAGAVAACPARAALPRCVEPAGERADRGNELHTFAECVTLDPSNRKKYEDAVSEEWRHTAQGMNLDEALDGIEVIGCEVAFVLNVKDRTCRRIGERIERKYEEHLAATGQEPLTKYDIPFTVDVLGWSKTLGCPVELDYKSGRSIGEVEDHAQRRISAAGVLFHYNSDTALSRVAYIWDDGQIRPDGHEFTVLDAWQICDEQVDSIDRVEAARALVAEGSTPTVYPDRDKQCRYCQSFDYCPYWNNLIRTSLDEVDHIATGLSKDVLSPEQKGKALDYVKDVLKAASELEKRLKEHVYKSPLPVDDRLEFRAEEQAGKSSFDAAAARGLIVTLLGQQGLDSEEIEERLKKLTRKGAPYPVITKRKRVLPVIKKSA